MYNDHVTEDDQSRNVYDSASRFLFECLNLINETKGSKCYSFLGLSNLVIALLGKVNIDGYSTSSSFGVMSCRGFETSEKKHRVI